MKIRLDDAIDQVAARMTAVTPDDDLAVKIVSALPERPGSLSLVWIARFAMGALATLALAVVLRTFGGSRGVGPAEAGRHSASVTPFEAGNMGVTPDLEPRAVSVASALRRADSRRPTIESDSQDHEFSLAAIDAVAALDVGAIALADLSEDAPLTLEPLVIADLPLTAEFSPQ